MTRYAYTRDDDGTLKPIRLYLYNGKLFTEDGDMIIVCRDCGEPITSTNWNGRCLPCHESAVG